MKKRSLPLPLASSGRRREGWQAGQEVVVCRGELAGQCGVLVRCIAGGRWVVRLDGLSPGIELVVVAAALKRRLGRTRN